MDRAERICRALLYIRPSQLRCYSPSRGEYDVFIGNGLFSSRDIPPNTNIVYFVGEAIADPILINMRRNRSERGGYLLTNATVTQALDCFDTCKLGQCLASFSNCPKGCFNVVKKRRAAANARLTMRALGNNKYQWGISSLISAGIAAHEEILWNYGAGYIYPEVE